MAKDLMPAFQANLLDMDLTSQERILIAVSGGPDSMALLHLFLRWDAERIGVFHLNHRFRAEAAEDAAFVEEYARDFAIPVHILSYDVNKYVEASGESKQQGARTIRYKLLQQCAEEHGYQRIALAHHGDDQAETVLMRLLRGSGLQGIAGIPPRRGPFIRPLLNVFKSDILAYCDAYQIPYVEDATNLQPIYLRNKIRVELMPLLAAEYNPQIATELIRLAELAREDNLELERVTDDLCKRYAEEGAGQVVFPKAIFSGLSVALQRRVLRQLIQIQQGHLLGVDFQHIEEWRLKLAENRPFHLNLPGIIVSGTQESIFAGEFQGEKLKKQVLPVPGKVETGQFIISAEVFSFEELPPATASSEDFDLADLQLPLFVRQRQAGDRLSLFGGAGTRKLKDLFIDARIPLEQRDYFPIICDQREILWLPGIRRGAAGPLKEGTRRVVRLSFAKIEI